MSTKAMRTSRRKLFVLAAGLPVSLSVLGTLDSPEARRFSYHRVKNQPVRKTILKDAVVLVNADVSTWSGDGLYLYPEWGAPVIYEVRKAGNSLAFYYPGSVSALWKISGKLDDIRFSGQVEGVLDDANALAAMARSADLELQPLAVPVLPLASGASIAT